MPPRCRPINRTVPNSKTRKRLNDKVTYLIVSKWSWNRSHNFLAFWKPCKVDKKSAIFFLLQRKLTFKSHVHPSELYKHWNDKSRHKSHFWARHRSILRSYSLISVLGTKRSASELVMYHNQHNGLLTCTWFRYKKSPYYQDGLYYDWLSPCCEFWEEKKTTWNYKQCMRKKYHSFPFKNLIQLLS